MEGKIINLFKFDIVDICLFFFFFRNLFQKHIDAVKQSNLQSAYIAMFDELDEGTYMFKVI